MGSNSHYKLNFIYSENWTPSGLLNLRRFFSKCSDFVSIFYNSFLSSFFLSGMVILHIYFLHKTGSNNPTNITRKFNLIRFHRFFSFKDIRFFFLWFFIFEVLIFLFPYVLGDPENFLFANSLSTPPTIHPTNQSA